MTESSRRGFLKYAGAGVAAAGAAAVVPTALAGPAGAAESKATVPANASGSLAAHVEDVHGDAVTLMIHGREVVVHDKDLVARLAQHMHRS